MPTTASAIQPDQGTETPAGGADAFAEWQARVAGTNISSITLLATDYLNHYNEVVMIVEMLPDMPDMMEDIADWEPITYAGHFAKSGLGDADLAIAAYDHVPAEFRAPFDATVAKTDQMIRYAIDTISAIVKTGDDDRLRRTCAVLGEALNALMRSLNGIVNGDARTVTDEEIARIIGR